MRTPIALLTLLAALLLAPAARADVGPPPGFKTTRGHAVVHFGAGAEKYRVFSVCQDMVKSLDGPAAEVHAYDGGYRGSDVKLCAIPAGTPVPMQPTEDSLKSVPGAIWSEPLAVYSRGSAVLLDPRDGDEVHYRATFGEGEIKLELTETRPVWSWPTVIVMGFLSLALALGGMWLVRRIRRRPLTRTTPPNNSHGE